MKTLLLALVLAATPALMSADARAQTEVDQSDPEALFAEGRRLYKEDKFEEAYEAYKRAFELRESYDIAGNLGNVEVKLGRFKDAVKHLRYVLDKLPPSLDADKRERVREKTQKRIDEAMEHVAIAEISTDPPGATVTVDGEAVGKTPLAEPLYLDKGKHTVTVELVGYQTLKRDIDLPAGSEKSFAMSLTKVGEAAPATDDEEGGGPNWIVVGSGLGVGAAAVGVGIALVAVAGSKGGDREALAATLGSSSACSGASPPAQCAELQTLSDDELTFRGAGIGLLVGGGALLAAAGIYALLPASSGDEGAWHVMPGPGTAGLSLQTSF